MSREPVGPGTLTLTVVLSFLCCLGPSYAQKRGFISIDCGASDNYTDAGTGIEWATDDGYITTGSNVRTTTTLQYFDNLVALKTSRCFPPASSGSRKKNCYTLPVSPDSTYLVRASIFVGGGSLSKTLKFEGSIDYSRWGFVTVPPSTNDLVVVAEAIFIAESEQTSICVIDIGDGTPCLAALELRPLGNAYVNEFPQRSILALSARMSCGTPAPDSVDGTLHIRYPFDDYDRRWQGTFFGPNSNIEPVFLSYFDHPRINTTLAPSDNVTAALSVDKPPIVVMQSAWEDKEITFAADSSAYLNLATTFILKMYVWDFVPYTANDTNNVREFETYFIRGKREEFLQRSTLSGTNTIQISSVQVKDVNPSSLTKFTIRATNRSQRQAMMNGAEIFAQLPLQQPTYPSDVSALVALQKGFGLSPLWTGDPCSPVSWDWISCNVDGTPVRVTSVALSNVSLSGSLLPSIGNLTELTDLWITYSNVSGTIPNELGSLKNLRTLHLNNNELTGPVPASLAALAELVELYIQDNDLNGTLPPELLKQTKLEIRATGNPKLQCNGPCDIDPSGKSKSTIGIIIGAVIAFVVFVLVALGGFVCLRRRTQTKSKPHLVKKSELPSGDVLHRKVAARGARAFALTEIHDVTQNFHNKIAQGGFGPVYSGKLADGQEVAVKVNSGSGHQGAKEFFMEVNLLSRVHHVNLVSLVGFCQEGREQILVYPYMRRGTLHDNLHGKERGIFLDWSKRLEIALDSARGLAYLHTGCKPPIIHRDVKSKNILLDERLTAKVADFGISKVTGEDTTGVDTSVKGTIGYLDPQYYWSERLTQKSDVYSFGVVLLEIVTGQPTISSDRHIVDTVRKHIRDNDMKAIVDPVLEGDYYFESMWKVVDLAMECVNTTPEGRPDMLGVVRGLQEAEELERSARASQQPTTTRNGVPSRSSAGEGGNPNPSNRHTC